MYKYYFRIYLYDLNRYRRGLETCPQASITQRRVENTRVHFWTFSPVSVNKMCSGPMCRNLYATMRV